MEYSIKEMSEKTGLSIPTLRFYDKEGLFPNLERKSSNYRTFHYCKRGNNGHLSI